LTERTIRDVDASVLSVYELVVRVTVYGLVVRGVYDSGLMMGFPLGALLLNLTVN
jgi:hypothetical protein